jgi:CheY-like chemotaxis protein
VVDADEVVGTMLAGALSAFDIQVDVATTGVAGLKRARAHRPALIIVAAFLPCMDAIDFVEACRHSPANRATPVVVTASTDELLRARTPLHAFGGVAVLTEPIQFDSIQSIVLPLARRNRGRRRD